MSFDFIAYLVRLDPSQTYSVNSLTGGAINVTVRATKLGKNVNEGRFSGHKTVVLKHAMPYVAAVGEAAPLTQRRQEIEARVLSMLDDGSTFGNIQERTNIYVPKLLHYDREDHILVLSDLGNLPTLSEVMGAKGGQIPILRELAIGTTIDISSLMNQERLTSAERTYYTSIGSRMGCFLAIFHSPSVLRSMTENSQMGPAYLENAEMRENIIQYVSKFLKSNIDRFPSLVQEAFGEDMEEPHRRVEQDWYRPLLDGEKSIAIGDCHTGSFLVSSPSAGSAKADLYTVSETESNVDPSLSVIDFELALISRGPHGDLTQVLAYLECFLIASRHNADQERGVTLELLIDELITSYRTTASSERAAWLRETDRQMSAKPVQDSLRAHVLRSALLGMAAELMNTAFRQLWPYGELDCPDVFDPDTEFEKAAESTSGERPRLMQLMRQIGSSTVWLIHCAGKDTLEMIEEKNWQELLRGPPGWFGKDQTKRRKWLLDLFI